MVLQMFSMAENTLMPLRTLRGPKAQKDDFPSLDAIMAPPSFMEGWS